MWGGFPMYLSLNWLKPLKYLFKDEVRTVGRTLGITNKIIGRHPFPGPGLGIRILEDITPEKVRMLQEADHIYISTLKETGWYDKIWQACTILLPVRSVGCEWVMSEHMNASWPCAPLILWME